MVLSDLSIKRPVVCLVASIIILLVGYLAFRDLPVREYPEVDSPVISISTSYPGASAEVVESRITEMIEKEVSAIDGIHIIRSSSSEEFSSINIEFNVDRDIDEAANDIREKVSRVRGRLPPEVDDSRIVKSDPDAQPIISLSFNSDRHSRLELTAFRNPPVRGADFGSGVPASPRDRRGVGRVSPPRSLPAGTPRPCRP